MTDDTLGVYRRGARAVRNARSEQGVAQGREQGIVSREQGNFLPEQGIFLAEQGIFQAKSTLDERSVAQVAQRLTDFGLGVHDDRPVPGDRFAQRPAGDQQEAHALFACLDDDLVAGVEHHQRTIADRVAHQHLLAVDLRLAQRAERFCEAPAKLAEPSKM